MNRNYQIIKSSGEGQAFSEEKLRSSLYRSGASAAMVDMVVDEVLKHLRHNISTKEIYRKAFQLLRKKARSNAARFSLKRAIMELGPSGFPFEHLVGEIFKKQGYWVEVGKTVRGFCVSHEVDVVAEKENHLVMIECKYHNTPGKICNVQVPLYIRSRFNDIENLWELQNDDTNKQFDGYVVTNTRFSEDALQYGNCSGLKLIGWDYPAKGSLRDLIEKAGLFPVTVITELTGKQKKHLLEKGILLCSELRHNPGLLDQLGLELRKRKKLAGELEELCSIGHPG